MSYAFKPADGDWIEIDGPTVRLPERTVSMAWVAGLSPEERAELGFVEVTGPEAPPEGQRIASVTVEDVDGAPVRVATYEDIPPPPVPDEVPMYKVIRLLIMMGLLGTVEGALAAIQGVEGEIARANWQRAPNLVRADPLVQGMAAQLGFDLDALVVAANALA